MRYLTCCATLIAPMCFAAPVNADAVSSGREVAQAFLSGEISAVWDRSTPEMREVFGSVASLTAWREDLRQDLGEETEVLSEQSDPRADLEVYTRISRWAGSDGPVEMTIALNNDGSIAGFLIRPQPTEAASPHLNYATQADMRLPFEGEWYVYWGGREIAENYHAADPAQRFALDLLVMKDGSSHQDNPTKPESYHCWGQEILAPADGIVAVAVDGLPDQAIGATDTTNPAGNHVVLDFDHGEFGFFAHLQQGSLKVAAGDTVSRGQTIGLCGNSGNTSEPHLHFHLQTSPTFGEGEGLPVQFNDYLADGQPIHRGEPARGQTVTNP